MRDEERIASWTGCSGWTPRSWKGRDLEAGAVASIEGILHPITAARLVMEDTNHVLLVGPPATRFAQQCQLEQLARVRSPRRSSGRSPRASTAAAQTMRLYRAMLKSKRTQKDQHGTVGAVALDRSGTVAAGASTGGIDSMLPGRVGDSPLIGCGVYADNQSGAVSMTGIGRRYHPPCDRQDHLRSSGYGKEPCGRRSTGVAHARVSDPWVCWGLSPLAGRPICHQACDTPYGCRVVERDRPPDRSRTISMKGALFHLAFSTRESGGERKHFYVDGLGCTLGRESSHAVTFGLAGTNSWRI